MPKADFGEKTHFDGNRTEFIQLKSKDEKIHIRFLGSAYYDGKHFLKQADGKWLVTYCPRIMAEKECEYCEKFFEAKKAMKAMKEEFGEVDTMTVENKAKYKGLEQQAEHFGATVSFFYPVLDRENEVAGILKCSQSTRWKLDEEHDIGIDILKFDYIYKRTEKPGTDYYTLTRMDSAQIKPLTDKEKEQVELAKTWNIEEMIYGNKSGFDFEQDAEEPEDPEYAQEGKELAELDDDPTYPSQDDDEDIDIEEIMEDLDGELPEPDAKTQKKGK